MVADDKEDIKTEQQLEELINEPEKLQEYIRQKVEEGVGPAVGKAVDGALKDHGLKRLPMAERDVEGKWEGPDDTKGNIGRVSRALNGKFKSLGEFLYTIAPGYITNQGVDPRHKVLGEIDGAAGGFTVPEQFVAQLFQLALEDAVVRPRALTIPMATEKARIPAIRDVSHATNVFGGVQGYWTAEQATLTASEPTFAQLALDAKKLTGLTEAANELLADNAIGLEALLMRLFGEALIFFEEEAFINGDGAGEPLGILNAPALVSVAKETGQDAKTIVPENLDNMYSRMLPRSKNRAVWLTHPDTFPQLAGLSRQVGTGGSAIWITNMAGGPPTSIHGRPVFFTEHCQTLGTKGDIYFVDFGYYVIGDRQALTMAASPHVKFTSDITTWRFIQRLDGRPWIDTALTPRYGTNTLSPIISLDTRA